MHATTGLDCIDLFAGAGGFSLAARRAGMRVRLAIELDRHAVATYRANLCVGDEAPRLLSGDMSAMDPDAIRAETFGSDGSCALVLGGPPCQGFSMHRFKDAGVGDRRNDLVDVYFDFVRAFRPRAFLMENVPGMLQPRHARHLASIRSHAAEAGYRLFDPAVLDARDFGVPQRRKRVFLLGVSGDVDVEGFRWPPAPTHGKGTARPWTDCSSAFREAAPGDPNDLHMRHNDELVQAFERTPPNGGSRASSGRVLDCHRNHDGHSDVYGRIDPSQPGPTMTTACVNPSKGRFVHPTLHHGITVRQAARMQTFPDDFIFHGGLMAAGRQVGNAVPVDLGAFLVRHLMPLLVSGTGKGVSAPPSSVGAACSPRRASEISALA